MFALSWLPASWPCIFALCCTLHNQGAGRTALSPLSRAVVRLESHAGGGVHDANSNALHAMAKKISGHFPTVQSFSFLGSFDLLTTFVLCVAAFHTNPRKPALLRPPPRQVKLISCTQLQRKLADPLLGPGIVLVDVRGPEEVRGTDCVQVLLPGPCADARVGYALVVHASSFVPGTRARADGGVDAARRADDSGV